MAFMAFNENGKIQDYDSYSQDITCPKCKKTYSQYVEDQIPGFRDRSYDICPYCNEVNGSSMEYDYTNSKKD